MLRWIGIDFSGNVQMWTPGCRRSNVWIAEIEEQGSGLHVAELRRVQDLPGSTHPFRRLAAYCRGQSAAAIGIDAPFSIPQRHLPLGGFTQLLQDVAAFPRDGRPFAHGKRLVDYALCQSPLERAKPLRETEDVCRSKGINVRSTLWDGPRGGAAFTVACLTLIESIGLPCWPWRESGTLLVEAFPAAQLEQWKLPYARYDKDRGVRETILSGLESRVGIGGTLREVALSCADALDAVVCAFAGRAAVIGQVVHDKNRTADDEGRIAVHV